MERKREKLRNEYGLTEKNLSKEEMEVIHLNDSFLKNLPKVGKSEENSWMKDKLMVEKVDKLTAAGICVIDKVCILSYGLDDPRTSPTLRQVYLEQEQLMIDLVQLEREEGDI